jgi:antitoxin HicB
MDDRETGASGPAFRALFEPEPEGGFTVTFPEAGIAASCGKTWEEALHRAEDLLEEAILGMIAHGDDVPAPAAVPSADRLHPLIRLPAPTAARLEVYRAMRAAGLGPEQLAGRLGWEPRRIARLLSGPGTPRLEDIETVLGALGRRLTIASEPV